MGTGVEAILGILRRRYDEAYSAYRACLSVRANLNGSPPSAGMREREAAAAREVADARERFENALDALAESTRAGPHPVDPEHECDQEGEWVAVIDESEDEATSFDAPTCSICGDAQVFATRGEA